jgi:methionyl-tRNA synthetase
VQSLRESWAEEEQDRALRDQFTRAVFDADQFTGQLQFHRALESIWWGLDQANRYVVQTAPFTLIKDPAKQARVGEILYHLLEVLRALARVLAPFMPDTAAALREMLALGDDQVKAPWGQGFKAGHKVTPGRVLFPRIETEPKK